MHMEGLKLKNVKKRRVNLLTFLYKTTRLDSEKGKNPAIRT
jgi:hypothetical protein